jgi:hypothetical protein
LLSTNPVTKRAPAWATCFYVLVDGFLFAGPGDVYFDDMLVTVID